MKSLTASLLSMITIILIQLHANAAILISCHDGDTCRFSRDGGELKVRLNGIDAPEIDQPFGNDSRAFLVSQLKGKQVDLQCIGKSYDRVVCKVFVESKDLQKELVRNGWALDSPKYSGGLYKKDQLYAQENKLGIWKRTDNYSPYCWRWLGIPKCNINKLFQE